MSERCSPVRLGSLDICEEFVEQSFIIASISAKWKDRLDRKLSQTSCRHRLQADLPVWLAVNTESRADTAK